MIGEKIKVFRRGKRNWDIGYSIFGLCNFFDVDENKFKGGREKVFAYCDNNCLSWENKGLYSNSDKELTLFENLRDIPNIKISCFIKKNFLNILVFF